MLYRPMQRDGQPVPLSWPIAIYRIANTIAWPLEEDASVAARIFDRCFWIFGFAIFVLHNDSELRYFFVESGNLSIMLQGMPTYMILVELFLRAFPMGLVKHEFRDFLKKFYAEFYIPKASQPKIYDRIQKGLRPINFYTICYLTALSSFFVTPILSITQQGRKELLYKMAPRFDFTPLYIYIPMVLSSAWVGTMIAAMIYGEANVIIEVILHLNGRFELLRRDLHNISLELLRRNDAKNIAADFRHEVGKIVERNVALNKFISEFQAEFSYRLFISLSFSAGLICVLGFIVYTNPSGSIGFAFWTSAKVLEMLVIGINGSSLIATTDAVSSMYYECNWEAIIMHSSNTYENVRLMKMILMSITTNRKAYSLTGLNFFEVSAKAVLKILQGASSYFTCLIALR